MADLADFNLRHEARSLGIPLRQFQAGAELLDQGFTVPFIARYRKDQTDGLDVALLRKIQQRLAKHVQLDERKKSVLRTIESQGKLTDQLKEKINSAATSKRLEDLFLPYSGKKPAAVVEALEKGLKPLADAILSASQAGDLEQMAAAYVSEEKGVASVQDALDGAKAILAQQFSENIELRQSLRDILQKTGKVVSTAAQNVSIETDQKVEQEQPISEPDAVEASEPVVETPEEESPAEESAQPSQEVSQEDSDAAEIDVAFAIAQGALADKDQVVVSKKAAKRQRKAELHAREIAAAGDLNALQEEVDKKKKLDKKAIQEEKLQKAYADYFKFSEDIRRIAPYRILTLNRGERAKVLKISLSCDEQAAQKSALELLVPENHPFAAFLAQCANSAVTGVMTSLEREARKDLTERAESHAVDNFARNLSTLLLQRPVSKTRILAVDPWFKSGCKIVALDQFGNFIDRALVFIVAKKSKMESAKQVVVDMVKRNGINVVAIGNGNVCREAEQFFANLIASEEAMKDVSYAIVNEAGSSVYANSALGRQEFPDLDAAARGAISIGRRLLNPLSELVKIEPANIGIGPYQYDVKTKNLKQALENVVEDCVNKVGVNLNQANASLLRYVSGLTQLLADKIVEYRRKNGLFKNRRQLLDVPGITEQIYAQAAGFLKVEKSDEPLDATWIHPESYEAARAILSKVGFTAGDLFDASKLEQIKSALESADASALSQELGLGEAAVKEIIAQLAQPGKDPREETTAPVLKKKVLELEDLEPGMKLKGSVLNVVDFGAFIDFGMRDSGLVHVSELADKYIHDPHEVVAVGDIVDAWVVNVDKEHRHVSLTLIDPSKPRTPASQRGSQRGKPEKSGEGEQEKRPFKKPRGEKREGAPRSERRDFHPLNSENAGEKREFKNRKRDGEGRPERRDGDRQDRGPRRDRTSQQREFVSKAPVEPKKDLTDKQKTGKEPMRSFGDLAQLFKMTQNNDEKK